MNKALSNKIADAVITLIKYGIQTYALQTLIMYSFVFGSYNFLDGESNIVLFADRVVELVKSLDVRGLFDFVVNEGMALLKEYTFLTYFMSAVIMAMMMFGKYIKKGVSNFFDYLIFSRARRRIIGLLLMLFVKRYVRNKAAANKIVTFEMIYSNRSNLFHKGLFSRLFDRWILLRKSSFGFNTLGDIISSKEKEIVELCEKYARRCA